MRGVRQSACELTLAQGDAFNSEQAAQRLIAGRAVVSFQHGYLWVGVGGGSGPCYGHYQGTARLRALARAILRGTKPRKRKKAS